MKTTLHIEGVEYVRHVVRFRLLDGRTRRWIRYSPGLPWIREEVGREIAERIGIESVVPGSCSIRIARVA